MKEPNPCLPQFVIAWHTSVNYITVLVPPPPPPHIMAVKCLLRRHLSMYVSFLWISVDARSVEDVAISTCTVLLIASSQHLFQLLPNSSRTIFGSLDTRHHVYTVNIAQISRALQR